MTEPRALSPAEAAVLDALLPEGLTSDMQDVALCLFEAIVLLDARCGTRAPAGAWLAQLEAWATQVRAQLLHLASEMGGGTVYLAKGVSVQLSARDRAMCERFRGNNYRELARDYDLTEMRVRQIVDAWQRARYLSRQRSLLPEGAGDDDIS